MAIARRLMRGVSHIPPDPVGTILWQDTPASAIGTTVTSGSDSSVTLQNWAATPWNIYGGTAVKVVADGVKGRAIQFSGLANEYGQPIGNYGGYQSQRGEQSPNFEVLENQTLWFGFDAWVSTDIGLNTGWQDLFQLKNETEGSPTLAIGVNESSYGDGASIHLVAAVGPDGTPNRVCSLGATPAGSWTRIVLGMHVTKDGATSWVEAWRDGASMLARTQWATYNQAKGGPYGGLFYSDSDSGYFKFGIYRAPANWDIEYRLANLKLGTGRTVVS